jgi:hypothetical protein
VDAIKDILKLNKGDSIYAPIEVLKVKKGEATAVLINGVEYVKKPAGQKRRK